MNRMRGYHSTAVLLPDGSVFVGGDQGEGADASETTVEVYQPWYFGAPSRPALNSAPSQAGYGADITLGTPATGLSKVVMVRTSSTTHAMNTDQRLIELAFRTAAGSVVATTPSSPNLAPPGPYLVFLVDGQNVPSAGRFVSLTGTAPPPPAPNQPPTVVLTAPADGASFTAPATVAITATASDPDGAIVEVEFLADGAVLASDGSSPYSYSWNNVPAGSYTLTARATDNGGASTVSAPVRITVTTAPAPGPTPPVQAVTGFTLIDADTDQPVAGFDPLPDGAVLNLATLPSRNLNVRANTSPSPVGSVRFALDGNANYRTESAVPYALAGDAAGDYAAWTPGLGAHSLAATPYDQAGGAGTAGTASTVDFTVVDDPGPPPAPPPGAGGAAVSQTSEGRNGDGSINDRCPVTSVGGASSAWMGLLALGSLAWAMRRRA